jgi:hypothetical protein
LALTGESSPGSIIDLATVEQLHGNLTAEIGLTCPINDCKPTPADLFDNLDTLDSQVDGARRPLGHEPS